MNIIIVIILQYVGNEMPVSIFGFIFKMRQFIKAPITEMQMNGH